MKYTFIHVQSDKDVELHVLMLKCLLLLTKFYIVHVHSNFCLYFVWCEDHQFICRKKDSVRFISYEYVGFNLLYTEQKCMVINTC